MDTALEAMSAAGSRMLDPVLDACAAYPLPSRQPPSLDYVGLVYQPNNNSIITEITDPLPIDQLSRMRNDLIESTNGSGSLLVVHKSIAAKCRVGMSKALVLDLVEHVQSVGYAELGYDRYPKPNPRKVNSRMVVGQARTEIEIEQGGRWIPFARWWKGRKS